MRTTWTTWLLTGALVASLQWNVRSWWRSAGARDAPTSAARCEIDSAALGLTDEQVRVLGRLCREPCAAAEALEGQAEDKLRELRTHLSRTDVDVETLRGLVREASQLRARSLDTFVDSILDVREVLDGEQLEALLKACCPLDGGEGRDCRQTACER